MTKTMNKFPEIKVLPGAITRTDYGDALDDEHLTVPISIKVGKRMSEIMQHVVNDDRWEYHLEISRLVRHAIWELLGSIGMADEEGPVANWWRWDLGKRERSQTRKRMLKFKDWLSPFSQAMHLYVQSPDKDLAIRQIAKDIEYIYDFLKDIKEPWWKKYLTLEALSDPFIKEGISKLNDYVEYHQLIHDLQELALE